MAGYWGTDDKGKAVWREVSDDFVADNKGMTFAGTPGSHPGAPDDYGTVKNVHTSANVQKAEQMKRDLGARFDEAQYWKALEAGAGPDGAALSATKGEKQLAEEQAAKTAAPSTSGAATAKTFNGQPLASDGQAFGMQSEETRKAFIKEYGPNAPSEWLKQHEAQLKNPALAAAEAAKWKAAQPVAPAPAPAPAQAPPPNWGSNPANEPGFTAPTTSAPAPAPAAATPGIGAAWGSNPADEPGAVVAPAGATPPSEGTKPSGSTPTTKPIPLFKAKDGQALVGQKPEVQSAYTTRYGDKAAEQWAKDHDAATAGGGGGAAGGAGGTNTASGTSTNTGGGTAGGSGAAGSGQPTDLRAFIQQIMDGLGAAIGSAGSGGGGGGSEATELFNAQVEIQKLNAVIAQAQMAYQMKKLELIDVPMADLEREKLAQQAAQFAANQEIQKAGLTGELDGVQTLAAKTLALQEKAQADQTGLAAMSLVGSLRGPRNAFKQQEVMYGLDQQGLNRTVDALAGRYAPPGFQAPQAQAEPVTLRTMAADMNNPGVVGQAPAVGARTAAVMPQGDAVRGVNPVGGPAVDPRSGMDAVRGITPVGGVQADPRIAGDATRSFQPVTDQYGGVPGRPAPSPTPSGTPATLNELASLPSAQAKASAPGGQITYDAWYRKYVGEPQPGQRLPSTMVADAPPSGGRAVAQPPAEGEAMRYASAGTGGAVTPQDYLNALPAPNKINARNFLRLAPSGQEFSLGAYEAAGYDPGDVLHSIKQTLPQFRAPVFGQIAA